MYWVGFPNTHMDHVSKFQAYTIQTVRNGH